MGDGPLFSIIMPVYNVEKYLSYAVESVLNQSLADFELILVDDCSTDESSAICDLYAEKDNRIVVIHKHKNEGLGAARNTGLQECKGQWLMFMDSDDWISQETLEKLNDNIICNVSLDIIVFGYTQEFEQTEDANFMSVEVLPHSKYTSGSKNIAETVIELDFQRCFSYAWNKIYARKLIIDNNYKFTSTPLIEDFLFNIDVFKKCKNILILEEKYYHYRKPRHETLVSKYVKGFYELCKLKYHKEEEIMSQYGVSDEMHKEMLVIIHMKHILSSFMKECSRKSRKNILEQYTSVKQILKDPITVQSVKCLHTKNKKIQILKIIILSQNTFVNFMVTKLAITIQQKVPKIWQIFL